MFIDILLIAVILVCITDVSGFWEEVHKWLEKWLKCRVSMPKILVCSLCQTHWCGLLYLLITGQLSLLSYAMVLLVAICTPLIYNAIINIREIIGLVINIPMTFFK